MDTEFNIGIKSLFLLILIDFYGIINIEIKKERMVIMISKKYLIYSDYNYKTNNLGEKGKITSLIDVEGNVLVVGDCVSFKQKDDSTFGDSIVIIDDLHPKGTCLYYSYGNLNAFDGFLRHGNDKLRIEKNLKGSVADFKSLSYLEREG